MISVTEIAAKKIVSNLTRRGQGVGIRLGVRTTGCSGLAYVLEYVDTVNDRRHYSQNTTALLL
jgi:iron-sulfur cluster assembly protein